MFFYQTACERQLYKIRLNYYRAILRQDIGWFDGNPSGELASRLSELSNMGVGGEEEVGIRMGGLERLERERGEKIELPKQVERVESCAFLNLDT